MLFVKSLQFGMVSPTWSCHCTVQYAFFLALVLDHVCTLLVRLQGPTDKVRTFWARIHTLSSIYTFPTHPPSFFSIPKCLEQPASEFQSFMNHPAGTLPERILTRGHIN